MILADIRFPLERANGVQIVKTAAALARAGSRVRLVVRRSDPRPTPEVLALFGVEPHPCLEVRRLRVLHRRGSFVLPRASFLARAAAAGLAARRRGATVGTRDAFAERHGARRGVRVVPNGCDVPSGRAFPGLAHENPPRVLYAGQLYPWKGVDVLVEAMAAVPGARLVILGGIEGEADTRRIRSLVEARGLGGRTEMPGPLPQARVADALGRAAVVVAPFLRAGMTESHTSPLKIFEAMAAGRPIVASDLPSSREVLSDGENALLVPPGDVSALAGALRRVLADGDLARRLARAAWEAAPRYSWDARARALRELFEEVA